MKSCLSSSITSTVAEWPSLLASDMLLLMRSLLLTSSIPGQHLPPLLLLLTLLTMLYMIAPPSSLLKISQGTSLKRFVFDCSNISALRQEFGNQTTRFQVLAALVWGAVIAVKKATNHEYEPNAMSIATLPINLRNKTDSLSPPIPDQCIGSIISPALAFCPIKDTVDYKILAMKLQESISRINMESVKKTSADGSRLLRGRGTSKNTNQRSMLMISSLCRLPFYDTDFGWGKPVWVTIVRPE
ncbi:hypothetical protein Q3G72_007840 [Acer saccharum]|nr:hypothetical protein Q3G72_007840 [Acer saccharum]